uniref:Uncharacterized protein n=2 Tax=Anguilla anguilla TaxID=7936 RepID=A0A0E9V484_ANGAN
MLTLETGEDWRCVAMAQNTQLSAGPQNNACSASYSSRDPSRHARAKLTEKCRMRVDKKEIEN